MDSGENAWVTLLSTGMALTVVGLLLLESAAWYVQYAVLGLGLLLAVGALHVARTRESGGGPDAPT
jgi:uncharacterized membrane protein (UPF0136 family)